MRSRSKLSSLVLATLCVALGLSQTACQQAVSAGTPRAFNRPAALTFVCFEGDAPTRLDACRVGTDARTPAGFSLLALLPQQTRGEVGAVDLSQDPPRVLDSDRRVPGFTFVQVGEVPSAIAISQTSPDCTWVANRGSRDLSGIQTVRFREESLATFETGGRLSLVTATSPSGRPESMVLVERAGVTELWITLPQDGAIARVVVTSSATACSFVGEPEVFLLPTEIPPAPVAIADPEGDAATLALCTASGIPASSNAASLLGPVPAMAELEPLPADLTELPPPTPLQVIVERDGDIPTALLIGDAGHPVIHRYDFAAADFIGSIRTDGPVRDLALTPFVPDTIGGPLRRYVYAIDDRDGTVFVQDATDGHLLPVTTVNAPRPNRLPYRAGARALEVIDTTGGVLSMRAEDQCTVVPVPAPEYLSGVFVAVALTDGTIRVVDVFDADALCRSNGTCAARFTGSEQLSFIRRHRPRIGARVASGIDLDDLPASSLGGASLRYDASGQLPEGIAGPQFVPFSEGCPSGLGKVYPSGANDLAPLACASTDPWSAEAEAWSIIWNGSIPGTATTSGRIDEVGGAFALDTQVDLCAQGVLGPMGSATAPPDAPEAGYIGDVVAITASLPDAQNATQLCRSLVGLDIGETSRTLLIPFEDAVEILTPGEPRRTRITIRADAPVLDRFKPADAAGVRAPFTMQDVRDCYGDELVGFDIRVQAGYAVVGSRSGFLHRVVRDDAGRCVVDPTQPVGLQGRAFAGTLAPVETDPGVLRPFVSSRLAFSLAFPQAVVVRPANTITFSVGGAPVQLGVDIGSTGGTSRALTLPSEIVWSPLDSTLYGLDELRQGLVIIRTRPSPAAATSYGFRIERFIQ